MGELVIAAYRANRGATPNCSLIHDDALHLRRLGLVTDRAPALMRAKDGTFVGVFEWRDGAIATAHESADVLALGASYAEVCEYVPLADLAETRDLFAIFAPLEN